MESLNMETFAHMILHTKPEATAFLQGSGEAPSIHGLVRFYPAADGTLVVAEVLGLPRKLYKKGKAVEAGPFYAFHIHEGSACGNGDGEEPFGDSKAHYNPKGEEHPLHAGDLPTLLSDQGYAYACVYTGRFVPGDVVGRTVVIHQHGEDYHTQPSGNAGTKLACGIITKVLRG